VKAGESYWWCSRGKSQNQPFCDGSHNGTEFAPLEFKPEEDGGMDLRLQEISMRAKCDGSHEN